MAQQIRDSLDWYLDTIDNKSDPRVKNWLLMDSPFTTVAILMFYVYFVKKLGPRLMQNRKPFKLNNVLIVYNAVQVVLSTYLFYEGAISGWFTFYSYRCQLPDYSDNPLAIRMARAVWLYYMSKFTELLDTVFFVLRKKYNQISLLHMIHHFMMPITMWVGVKFIPGGQVTFLGFANTFVHIIMYSYYLLAAMGPWIQPYLWWKKHLTLLQIVQFILVLIHTVQSLIIQCEIPKFYSFMIITGATIFIVMFSNFYYQSYLTEKEKANKISVEITAATSEFNDKMKKKIEQTDSVRQRGVSS